MEYEEIKELSFLTLLVWLDYEGVLGKYKKNLKKVTTHNLMTSFIWSESPEGLDFWSDLHYKWNRECIAP